MGCLGGHRQAIACWVAAGVAVVTGAVLVAASWDVWSPVFYIGLTLFLTSLTLLNAGTLLRRSRSLDDEYDAGYRSGYRAGRRALLVGLDGGRGRSAEGEVRRLSDGTGGGA